MKWIAYKIMKNMYPAVGSISRRIATPELQIRLDNWRFSIATPDLTLQACWTSALWLGIGNSLLSINVLTSYIMQGFFMQQQKQKQISNEFAKRISGGRDKHVE